VTDPATAAEPADLTPVQYALLDAVKDVALAPEAPAAKYATEQLARLAGEAFGYPLPAPVVREGGLAGFLLGRPVPSPTPLAGTAPIADLAERRRRATGGPVEVEVFPGRVEISPEQAVELGLRPADTEQPTSAQIATDVEGWPFKPGTVVRDEDGDDVAWLDAAPEGVVVRGEIGAEWTRTTTGWSGQTSQWIAQFAPLTVVSVPDAQEACTDETQDGPA
jgi:hypothetical protein